MFFWSQLDTWYHKHVTKNWDDSCLLYKQPRSHFFEEALRIKNTCILELLKKPTNQTNKPINIQTSRSECSSAATLFCSHAGSCLPFLLERNLTGEDMCSMTLHLSPSQSGKKETKCREVRCLFVCVGRRVRGRIPRQHPGTLASNKSRPFLVESQWHLL